MRTHHQFLAERSDLPVNSKKKRNSRLVYFPVSTEHRVEIKENEKLDKYLNLAEQLRRL